MKIPKRNTSKYSGQYAGAFDPQRIMQIFNDSQRIALTSKNPKTAGDRFDLAIETYHQLMSMRLSSNEKKSLQEAMEELAESFPTMVIINEARGLREKAQKLKTPSKRLDLFQQASEIVNRGLADNPTSSILQKTADEIQAEINDTEAAMQ
ncbi:MAG: hypothetical protein DRI65_09655 [Chloroflexota bacterium]|nr:MAG: hypothetical protein DRI65_09655 [Chloroflexota bacterium]